jgi:methylmalonyl-CoA mutase C-terminal domain/subunit
LLPEITRLLREQDAGDILVFAGGIIPDRDVETLRAAGIDAIFLPGTNTQDVVAYLRSKLRAA